MSEGNFQLRGCKPGTTEDNGALEYYDTLDEAFEKFLQGGYWKLSWKRPNGQRVRLVKEDDMIQVTDPADFVLDALTDPWREV